MAKTSLIDSFLLYQFIRRLTLPFEKWEAFKTGVIDKDGEILIKPNQRTPEQAKSLKLFDVLVLNLKRLLAKIPGGSSRFATFTAALFLLKESREVTEEEFIQFLNETYDNFETDEQLQKIHEEVANMVGTGNIAGTDGNPPVGKTAMLKRSQFAGCTVFDVDFDKVWNSRHGKQRYHKYSKYLGEDDIAQAIREYCVSNPKESIILRNETTGEMVYFKKVKTK